jgi:agmatinase
MSGTRIGIIGIPFDEKSSFLKGAAQGPDKIRESLHDGSSSYITEVGIELIDGNHFVDLGNLTVSNYLEDIDSGITNALNQESKLITLGGDHSVAYPVVKAYQQKYPDLHILQFDAHTDLYEEYEGDPYSHACPFARIMENKLAKSLTQIGIRVVSSHQKEQQKRFGVNIITMRDWVDGVRPTLNGPLYISFDLDVFDPGFAPGISHHEPGGMSPREVIELILEIDVPIIGADIVELNPSRDHHGMTASLAAKLLKELMGKMYIG